MAALRNLPLVALAIPVLFGQGKIPPRPSGLPAPPDSPMGQYLTDVMLTNQNGEPVRFYTDLIKGKVVVIDSFFATCQGACPKMAAQLSKLQDEFGDRFGKQVFFVSITVDPQQDTPEKLKEYAERFKAKPGWSFVTGTKENVNWALYKLGHYVEQPSDHSTIFVVGNEPTGLWRKVQSLASTPEVFALIEKTLKDEK